MIRRPRYRNLQGEAKMSDDAPPGVPEWVVTYGDMMSLLLTFFIMLVSMSEVAAEEKYRAIMESLQQYLGYRSGPAGPPGKNFPLNSMIEALQTLGSYTNTELGRGGVRVKAPEGDQVRVLRSREGERLRVGDLIHFGPGSDELTDSAKAGLRAIAKELAGKPNKVEIRAHAAPDASMTADALAVLSYRRGRAARKFLESHGIARERLRITAAGATEPLPDRGDERVLEHDRVEVLLLDEFAATYIGPRTAPQ